MRHVWNRHTQVPVEYNEDQQLIGKSGRECRSFICTLAKYNDIIPVTPQPWRSVDQKIKDDAWAEIWVNYCLMRKHSLHVYYYIYMIEYLVSVAV